MLALSTLFSDATKEAMAIFLNKMKSVCMDYGVDFRDLLEAPENVAGDLFRGR